MIDNHLSNPKNYRVLVKGQPHAKLSDEQAKAISSMIDNQGDLSALDDATRKALAGLEARTANDPTVAGAAAIIDFSVRAVSIHKTWSVFKKMEGLPGFDPQTLPRVDVTMADIVRTRG